MRRKYLVDRNLQLRLILLIIILVMVATSVSAIATFILANREIGSTFYLAHRDTWDLKELLLPVVVGTSLVTFLLISVISIVIVLRESHRIVGPIKRLTRALKDLSEGRISFVGNVRRGDVLGGLDRDINTLSENLARVNERLKVALDELNQELKTMKESGVLSDEPAERIRKFVHDFEETLEFFKKY